MGNEYFTPEHDECLDRESPSRVGVADARRVAANLGIHELEDKKHFQDQQSPLGL